MAYTIEIVGYLPSSGKTLWNLWNGDIVDSSGYDFQTPDKYKGTREVWTKDEAIANTYGLIWKNCPSCPLNKTTTSSDTSWVIPAIGVALVFVAAIYLSQNQGQNK